MHERSSERAAPRGGKLAARVVRRGPGLFRVPGRHRGLSPDFHPGPAGNARRTAVAGGVHQLSRLRHRSPLAAAGLVAGHGRPGHGGLPVGFRGRPDPALRRADPGRHGRRRGADRPGLRGGATGDGHRLADHLRAVSCLWPVRRTPAGRPGPPRLRLRPDRQPAVVRYRRSLRHADLRIGHLHLSVHPVRRLPRAGRHDPPVHRFRHGPVRSPGRRAGQGLGILLGADGHHHRLRRGQRGHHRTVHHPADEAFRLQAGVRRRRRGDREHGQPTDAAGDGGGGVHYGRDHQRPLRGDRQGGADPGPAVFRLGVLDGPPRGPPGRSKGPAARSVSERLGCRPRALVPADSVAGADRAAVLRAHAAVLRNHRPGADRHRHPRFGDHPAGVLARPAHRLLGGAGGGSSASASG